MNEFLLFSRKRIEQKHICISLRWQILNNKHFRTWSPFETPDLINNN